MTRPTYEYIICDFCGSAVPEGADFVHGGGGYVRSGGNEQQVAQVDFCCTEHFVKWLEQQPNVPTPDPLYPVPPPPSGPSPG